MWSCGTALPASSSLDRSVSTSSDHSLLLPFHALDPAFSCTASSQIHSPPAELRSKGQTNIKRKLLNASGASAVEYNAEQALLTVPGDPNPSTLLRKLTKWGKTAELVSAPTPRTPEHNQIKTMEKRPKKGFLLRCLGRRSIKAKVEPYRGAVDENGCATPFISAVAPQMVYPHPQAIHGFATHIPYPAPCFGESQPPPHTYTAGMFRSAPP